jgi:hypothetical protein
MFLACIYLFYLCIYKFIYAFTYLTAFLLIFLFINFFLFSYFRDKDTDELLLKWIISI